MAQWLILHASGVHGHVTVALSAGIGIFGAAFVLSWSAEAAQVDIPPALSIAFIALIAVLPEYAVDIYFAWEAGKDPAYVHYATANMTGANRLLIGAGWPVVLFAYWWKTRNDSITLEEEQRTELGYLLAATAYSFIIPLKGTLSPVDGVVLIALFGAYMVAAARAGLVEPELEGPAEMIARLPTTRRRAVCGTLFAAAGLTIFVAAEPFAEALLGIGEQFGIDRFLLVQWLAPLASESPEFIVAILFAVKGKPGAGFSALVSSKVNQWTLLVGMLPLVYILSLGHFSPMHLDARQSHEILLTSAQSLFAVVLLADFKLSMPEALALLILFSVQLAWPDATVRLIFVVIYLVAAIAMVLGRARTRAGVLGMIRAGIGAVRTSTG
ncbi:MAG: sodium:calcium antiporter [Deltaproteobacteria bacterium]|nr:MAG: sodium:calcium antiporter [Deltaproteobacteria bacterium]